MPFKKELKMAEKKIDADYLIWVRRELSARIVDLRFAIPIKDDFMLAENAEDLECTFDHMDKGLMEVNRTLSELLYNIDNKLLDLGYTEREVDGRPE